MRAWAILVPERGVPLNLEEFPFQEAWYSEEVAVAREVVWQKAAQVGMCLRENTRVLTADLRWVEIGGVRPGDELVAVDELATGHGMRYMRRAVVYARWETRREAVRIIFSDGSSVDCSREHRWLARPALGRRANIMGWLAASDLRVGDRIRAVTETWERPTAEDGWMAGVLDGEGCLSRRAPSEARQTAPARLMIVQNEGVVLERARAYLRERGYVFADTLKKRSAGVRDGRTLTLARGDEVMRLLGSTRPARWAESWWEGQRMFAPRDRHLREVIAVESLGKQRLVDIETSAHTFVAEGLVSHNSGYAWRWAARRAEQFDDRVMYFFPTDDDVSDFGDQRIEPSIQDSAYLLKRIPASYVRQKHLKQIGGGWLALRGTQSKTAVQSVDADALVFDEYDYLHQKNLEQAERRIAGAVAAGRTPRVRRFGYPTVAGYGISSLYERSDRRRWLVTCPECDAEQALAWEFNVRWRSEAGGDVCRFGADEYENYRDVVEVWRCCKECEASLETEPGVAGPIHRGRWVASRPESDLIGFHVSRLIVPRTDLVELVRNSRKLSPAAQEAFWNNDLGLPYSPAEAALTLQDVEAACVLGNAPDARLNPRLTRVAGLDVAGERDLSIWIDELTPDGQQRAVYVGEPIDFKEAADLLVRYRVNLTVVDSMPERRSARALAATFPGRVILAQYDDKNNSDAFKYDPKKNMVTINRTEGMDAFMDGIRQQRRVPPRVPPARFASQLCSPKRRTIEDAQGRPKRVYVSTGPDGDDWAHAGVYGLVAREMWNMKIQVDRAVAGNRGQPVADERFGFRDEYRAGFNE